MLKILHFRKLCAFLPYFAEDILDILFGESSGGSELIKIDTKPVMVSMEQGCESFLVAFSYPQ